MIFTTEQFTAFDACERQFAWLDQYRMPRVTLATALYKALSEGLKSGMPEKAHEKILRIAANPGLAISAINLYAIALHHATLLELLTTYLLSTSAEEAGSKRWKRADTVAIGDHSYRPQSYHLRDGRLRRVVLCSSWNAERELEERNCWRTVGDIVATGRPMLINALVIGRQQHGFRPSVWTLAREHPINRTLRIQLRPRDDHEKAAPFSDDWRKVYREQSGLDAMGWLKLMQDDNALSEVVKTIHVEVPRNASEIRSQMGGMLQEMSALEAPRERRASCYRAFSPCPFASVCPRGLSDPCEAGFQAK